MCTPYIYVCVFFALFFFFFLHLFTSIQKNKKIGLEKSSWEESFPLLVISLVHLCNVCHLAEYQLLAQILPDGSSFLRAASSSQITGFCFSACSTNLTDPQICLCDYTVAACCWMQKLDPFVLKWYFVDDWHCTSNKITSNGFAVGFELKLQQK